jgi:hypothetical protein
MLTPLGAIHLLSLALRVFNLRSLKVLIYLRYRSFLSSNDLKIVLCYFAQNNDYESRQNDFRTSNGICSLSCV